ncbi:MarR family transcriptional regulator [Zhengella mangrovi]|uniref:MarR family transcriptional regulator n=1 Tax=Zhengella mangrovi TaxID=1982044 RepID=A0A2G1QL27_9HYPH|nr:MarR family transcriptional regulator [Zhengella mangrovi]PHP66202.1 MarR family transcriptional regulator [Zhengella mangrovi]
MATDTKTSKAEDPAADLALEDFLPYRLNRLADLVSRSFSRIYRERHGMTRPEWRVLASLGQFGRATASDIVTHSSQHKTKVSRAVAALEKRGWLKRESDENDRRVEHLELTRAGRGIYAELAPFARSYEAAVFAEMGDADWQALERGLSRLEDCLIKRP